MLPFPEGTLFCFISLISVFHFCRLSLSLTVTTQLDYSSLLKNANGCLRTCVMKEKKILHTTLYIQKSEAVKLVLQLCKL